MAGLDLPSQESHWGPWHGTKSPSTPQTIPSVESANVSGTIASNESVFYLSDQLSCLTITQPSLDLAAFSERHRAYITLSVAIYLLSNNFVYVDYMGESSVHRGFFETLDSVFKEMPACQLRALLHSRLASVRAAFEALLSISGHSKQHYAFKSLVEIGASNNWLAITTRGHRYLYHAVGMGLDEVVQQLLKIGCRPEGIVKIPGSRTTAIILALKRHNIPCAKLLLKHCDVNKPFLFPYRGITSFTLFIEEMSHLDDMLFEQGMKLFINAGADLDSLLGSKQTLLEDLDHPEWSALDYLFCFHPLLFRKVTPSQGGLLEASQPTRVGILTSLKLGHNTLSDYCSKLARNIGWEHLHGYLELLVAEQLTGTGPWKYTPHRLVVDLNNVYALVDLGVSMNRVLSRGPLILKDYIEATRDESDLEVVRYLLDNGAIVDDGCLQKATELKNHDLLAFLVQNMADVPLQGPRSVVIAAIDNNFEAVKILLDAGVDVNAEIELDSSESFHWAQTQHSETTSTSVSVLCNIIVWWKGSLENLTNMIEFLVQQGAHLRRSAIRPHLSDLMESVLRH